MIIYDSNGNKIEHINYNSEEVLSSSVAYTYDSLGNLIEKVEYYNPEEGFTSVYKQYTIVYRAR